MSKESKAPGIIIYLEDFCDMQEQFSDEEIGRILTSVGKYCVSTESGGNGYEPEFPDRSMKVVYKHLLKRVEADRKRYEDRCAMNSLNAAKRWDVRV